jgi:hypothetical protein
VPHLFTKEKLFLFHFHFSLPDFCHFGQTTTTISTTTDDPDNHMEKSRIDLLCTLSGALFDIYLRAPVQVHSWLFSSSSMTPMWKKIIQKKSEEMRK